MPNETIERAIKRGAGGPDAAELIEATYEGYGPGGVAVLINVVTDNRNRSVSEIRATMGRAGGNLSEAGSVAWLFDNKGSSPSTPAMAIAKTSRSPPSMPALRTWTSRTAASRSITRAEDLEKVRQALQEQGIAVESAELTKVPKTTVNLGEKEALQALKLLDKLEELDDVQRVHSNAEFSDEAIEAYEG